MRRGCHALRVDTEPIDKCVRGSVGDTVVVDTRTPLLFWEKNFPVPSYAVDTADVCLDLLVPTSTPPPGGFDFFAPHGPVSETFDLVVGDQTVPHAAWRRDDPALHGRIVLTWSPETIDWREEDEPSPAGVAFDNHPEQLFDGNGPARPPAREPRADGRHEWLWTTGLPLGQAEAQVQIAMSVGSP